MPYIEEDKGEFDNENEMKFFKLENTVKCWFCTTCVS